MTKIERMFALCDAADQLRQSGITTHKDKLREMLTLMQEMRSAMSSHNVLVMNDAMAAFDEWNCGE